MPEAPPATSGHDDAVNTVFPDDAAHLVKVGDICLDEGIVRFILDILEVGKVTGIRQLVEVDDMIVGIFVDEKAYYMTADKTGTAGDEYVAFHHTDLCP